MEEGPPRGNPKMEWDDYMAMRRFAAEQAKTDIIRKPQFEWSTSPANRWRTINNVQGVDVSYIPSTPPAFAGRVPIVSINYDPGIMPLASVQDPNYWAQQSFLQDGKAQHSNAMWKMHANKLNEFPYQQKHLQADLDELAADYSRRSNLARVFKERAYIEQGNYARQVGISAVREQINTIGGVNVNTTAELAEQAARDYEFASPKNKPKALLNLNKYLGNWNELAGKLGIGINKGGYLLSNAAGGVSMIADAGRLAGGGGIGVSPDGLPMIQSKSEMQQDAGVPEELRGSFRISTDEEMANYRKELLKQDAETKRLEELGKVLLAKQERKKTNDAIDAGAGMLNKMSGSKDWSSILGL
jgi:hypothetical protein